MSLYLEKLRDPRWQKKRLEILNRDGFFCQNCGNEKNTLHIHHRYYEKQKDPWDYPDQAFITLCECCHETETIEFKQNLELLINSIKRSKFLGNDLKELANGISDMTFLHSNEVIASVYSFAFSNTDIQKILIDLYFDHLNSKKNG